MSPFALLSLIWGQKAKISLLLFLVSVFTFMLFPLNDLRELVTIKVYEQSGRRIFILFNTINFGIFPPHLSVGELKVSTPQMASSLKANQVTVIPYSDLFIKQSPAGEVIIEGLWSGQTKATLRPGKLLENNVKSQKITFLTEDLNLRELAETLRLPMKFKGTASLNADGQVDPSLVTQPDIDFDLNIKNLELPASQIETMLGPLNLPRIKLGDAKIKGRWAGGRAQIELLQFGKPSDDISGSGKGYITLNVQNHSGRFLPEIGGYQLELDLSISRTIEPQLSLFLSLLDPYKISAPLGNRYRFRLSGSSFQGPPNFGPFN